MSRFFRHTFFPVFMVIASVSVSVSTDCLAQEPVTSKEMKALAKSTRRLTDNKFQLEYKFHPGETVFYEVIHQTAVDTKVQGNTEKVKSRSKSLKKWEFQPTPAEGTSEFTHAIDHVIMWSEMTGRKGVRYDSRVDDDPPPDYESIAKTLGKPISRVRIDSFGKILQREDEMKQIDRGTGGLIMPLPPVPIQVKTEWNVPSSIRVQTKEGRYKEIKTRLRYRLEKVQTGIATISLETQVLTPVTDARIKSQLLQKLSAGTIRFDIDSGRMVSKQLEWDETVIGFNGPESSMSFMAKMTEKLVPNAEVAALRKVDTSRTSPSGKLQ